MTTVLLLAAYIAIAAAIVYLDQRFIGGPNLGALWLAWPLLIPCLGLVAMFMLVADLGKKHRRG